MVVRGKIRGNGKQLANYLLKKGDNDNVILLNIRGTCWQNDLHKSLVEMSLTSELTKTDKGLFHVQICPAYGEDAKMTSDDWLRAADIMEAETGFTGQKRAIVLHNKSGKFHAHVVWERFDHEKGVMIPNKFSRLAQDRARVIMEKELEHMRTPERNKQRPEMKEYLSEIWKQTEDAKSFMKAIAEKGYVVAAGTQRPYMVVDESGRSFNLVRQLENVKTAEVRERFRTSKLVKEKEAIEWVRIRQRTEKTKDTVTIDRPTLKSYANDNIEQITQVDNPSKQTDVDKDKTYRMRMSFTLDGEIEKQLKQSLKSVVSKMDEKQAKKQKLLDDIKKARIEKAKEFRENERDL